MAGRRNCSTSSQVLRFRPHPFRMSATRHPVRVLIKNCLGGGGRENATVCWRVKKKRQKNTHPIPAPKKSHRLKMLEVIFKLSKKKTKSTKLFSELSRTKSSFDSVLGSERRRHHTHDARGCTSRFWFFTKNVSKWAPPSIRLSFSHYRQFQTNKKKSQQTKTTKRCSTEIRIATERRLPAAAIRSRRSDRRMRRTSDDATS